jgi:hypothetical protein
MNRSLPISVAFRVAVTSGEEFLFFRLGVDDAGPAALRPCSEICRGIHLLVARRETDSDLFLHLGLPKLDPLALNKAIRTGAQAKSFPRWGI